MGGGPISNWRSPYYGQLGQESPFEALCRSLIRPSSTLPGFSDLGRVLGPQPSSLSAIFSELLNRDRGEGVLGRGLGWTPPPPLGGGMALPIFPSPLSTLLSLGLPTKRKIFVSYHHHRDQADYDALAAICDDCEFLQDNSLDRRVDSDDPEYQERRIREDYIKGTSVTVVLCGLDTYKRKFVDWEIYATLLKDGGLIGIQLPNAKANPANEGFLVPSRLHDNIQSGYALWKQWYELTAVSLRAWTEEAVARDKSLIRNGRAKKAQNG